MKHSHIYTQGILAGAHRRRASREDSPMGGRLKHMFSNRRADWHAYGNSECLTVSLKIEYPLHMSFNK